MADFPSRSRRHWRRALPLGAVLVAALALFLGTGLHEQLTFDAIALRYGELTRLIAQSPVLAMGLALLLYVAVVVFAIPGIWLVGVVYGALFGWAWSLPLTFVGGVAGATILYWAARTAFSDYFKDRAGPILRKLADRFRGNAASYLLFLRFAPMLPFMIANVAPAVMGISFRTFLWTTMVGITPGALAYAYAGEGLRGLMAERAEACAAGVPPCGEGLSAWDVLTPGILLAFGLLALTALLPVLIQALRARRRA